MVIFFGNIYNKNQKKWIFKNKFFVTIIFATYDISFIFAPAFRGNKNAKKAR
jgi:hypothetical protein